MSSALADFSSDKVGLAPMSFGVATAEFGEPTGRVAGSTPQAWWARLTVIAGRAAGATPSLG